MYIVLLQYELKFELLQYKSIFVQPGGRLNI